MILTICLVKQFALPFAASAAGCLRLSNNSRVGVEIDGLTFLLLSAAIIKSRHLQLHIIILLGFK